MASISNDPNGYKRIQFIDGEGNRKAVRLGRINRKAAGMILAKVEAILSAKLAGYPLDRETSRWLGDISAALYDKLTRAGLVDGREEKTSVSLGRVLDEAFRKIQAETKPSTQIFYAQIRKNLLDCFGGPTPVNAITPLEADRFRQFLKAAGLAPTTIARRIVAARYYMKQAVRWGWIEKNPFDGVRGGITSNPSRQFFITRDVTDKVMDACPDAQWRLLFALSRYGGLRCPSEHLALKWSDVLWDKDRIRVPSPKTSHHAGGECRVIPLFPELRKPLLEVFEEAEPGAEYVITCYRSAASNLRTQLQRIIHRTGLVPWPKLWHNLRATRQTELADIFPGKVVATWIGNSETIAMWHYLQVTDAHFAKAIKPTTAKAAQNPAQPRAESSGIESKSNFDDDRKTLVFPSDSAPFHPITDTKVGDTGLEPVTSGV